MSDSFTEVTHESWFDRIKSSIVGVLVGILLFLVSFPVLFVNEGNSVKTYKALKEGAGAVVSVAFDKVDKANENKLVHITATAKADTDLVDKRFNISVPNGIKLHREVEVYQWREKDSTISSKKNVGGSKTTKKVYKHYKDWSSSIIDASKFHTDKQYQNPKTKIHNDTTIVASSVKAGAFTLDGSLVSKITGEETVTPTKVPNLSKKRETTVQGGYIYISNDPSSPKIGDYRIKITAVKPQDVSIAARQRGSLLEPYPTSVKGKSVALVQKGNVAADMMFEQAQANNKTMTWIIRFIGVILMFAGLNLIMKPLSVVTDLLPIAGSIVGAGTFFIAILLTIPLSSLTIAIAWIFYRPVLGVILLAVAIGGGVMLGKKLKEGKEKSGNTSASEEKLSAPDIDLG